RPSGIRRKHPQTVRRLTKTAFGNEIDRPAVCPNARHYMQFWTQHRSVVLTHLDSSTRLPFCRLVHLRVRRLCTTVSDESKRPRREKLRPDQSASSSSISSALFINRSSCWLNASSSSKPSDP